MKAAWEIALKDLKLRIRDKSVFIFGVVAPLVLALVLNFVFSPAFADTDEVLVLPYGLVQEDEGDIGTAFGQVLGMIEEQGLFELTSFDDRAAAEAAIEDGDIRAVFIVPAGLTASVQSGQDAQLEVVGDIDAPTSAQIARSVAERFAQGVDTATLAVSTALQVGAADLTQVPQLAGAAAQMTQPVSLAPSTAVVRQLDGTTYLVAGFAIFFMFFVAGFGMTSLLQERNDGTITRLHAAPIPRWSILAGKAITSIIVALVAMTILMVVSAFLLGADWGDPLSVALLVLAGVLSGVGIMSLAGSFAKTAEQAGNIQAIIAVSLAMIGGVFFPIEEGAGFLSQLTFISPHAWFLRGLGDLTGGGGVAVVLPAVLAMLGFALVCGAAAFFLSKRVVDT